MLTRILDYAVDRELFRSRNSFVYRAQHVVTGARVILKVLAEPYPPASRLAWFKREYELLRSMAVPNVIRALSLESYENRWLVVLEDFGGESMDRLLKTRRLSIAEFLALASQMAEALSQVHALNIMHKDVNPSNVVVNPATLEAKLIDFGISAVLSREVPALRSPEVLEGTLAYISPEQTGRTNRAIDYRTDLYSMGVTFYEMLTGQLPFDADDAMELVHCHLARVPTPPDTLRPEIPGVLSALVLKLMAKNAEDRYLSAEGVKADLEECARQWSVAHRIEPFPLDQRRLVARFEIPQKLYGREEESAVLLKAVERVCEGGRELLLVSGYSGIGKSALVQESYHPLTRQRGYFISGKFDQLQRDIPYASLVQSFRSLIRQILSESPERIERWKRELSESLGPNAGVLVEVLPELQLILGDVPPVPELGPSEAQNRFNLVLNRFIGACASREHPLVLFLDDLQWVDAGSLRLLQQLMLSPGLTHLFLIGAYRDNEVTPGHPLALSVAELRRAGAIVNELVLRPLDLPTIQEMLQDTLGCSLEAAKPLAELLLSKTDGNPFFLREFLKSLYTEHLISLARGRSKAGGSVWQWDLARIRARNITDNVVELLMQTLRALDERTQRALMLAGLMGNQFNLDSLAVVCRKSSRETAADLWPALAQGLILAQDNNYKLVAVDVEGLFQELSVSYKFAHDRIQQAAYSLIAEEERASLHWEMGQLLLERGPPELLEKNLFDITNHLNAGRARARGVEESDGLAELNLRACRKAKHSAAFQAANGYARLGIELMGPEGLTRRRELAMALLEEAAETAYTITDFAQMDRWIGTALSAARGPLEAAKVHEIRIRAFNAQQRPLDAADTALRYLRQLGIHCPPNPSKAYLLSEMLRTRLLLARKRIEDLARMPEMTEREKAVAVRIIATAHSSLYVSSPLLHAVMTLKQVRLVATYGNTEFSSDAYGCYGLLLGGLLNDVQGAYQYGQLANELLSRPSSAPIRAQGNLMTNAFTRHYAEHLRVCVENLHKGYQVGLDTGELEYACYDAYVACKYAYASGENLESLRVQFDQYAQEMKRHRQDIAYNSHASTHQAVINLVEPTEDPCELHGEACDEETMIPALRAANDRMALAHVYLNKQALAYTFGQFKRSVAAAEAAEQYLDSVLSQADVPRFYFYDSLARLALFREGNEQERAATLRRVARGQKLMKKWAKYAPMNFQHKYLLVEAELLRLRGRAAEARELYDQSISLARDNGYVNEQALACEVASRFYLERQQVDISDHYLHQAHYSYELWGAKTKLRAMEAASPRLLSQARSMSRTTRLGLSSKSTTTEEKAQEALDLASVLKASQTIASEVVLSELLKRLTRLLIENAGAEWGGLLFERKGDFVIEAEGRADQEEVTVLQSRSTQAPDSEAPRAPLAILRFAARTQEPVVLDDATRDARFASDPYILQRAPRSILCLPILSQGRLLGLIYLENNLTPGAFTPERQEVLRLLSAQIAISIENAQLYNELERKVEERTLELKQKNIDLQSALKHLKATQAQLIQQEKLASLGQLTAGVAHEIKNPLNFINNFAQNTSELLDELTKEASLNPRLTVAEVEDLLADLRMSAKKIYEHGRRADGIVRSMLEHSRTGRGERSLKNLNAVVEEYVNLVHQGSHLSTLGFACQVVRDYDPGVLELELVPQEIGRVLMNLLNNAFHAVGERRKQDKNHVPQVTVRTRNLGQTFEIRVEDNGMGIPAQVRQRIFEPFFTTKPPGQGTGLGLSFSYEIITQAYGGTLEEQGQEGQGATFIVRLPVRMPGTVPAVAEG
ncbi:AAA family ATPase [Archangium violaceum]|uniref:ATP-binding sensor histidine kinase n=1 Tax=Archangium violaceum TaxID=83451 RepID=UPI00193B01F4|nr:ATP-binding sensor histidine kinase [Archangium violaceum]QRK10602.1 AAA family ATPase [Archangium violaceum]